MVEGPEGLNWALSGGLTVFLVKEVVGFFKTRATKSEAKIEKAEDSRLAKIEKEITGISGKLREIELTIVKHDVSEIKDSIKELGSDIQHLSEALAVDRAKLEAENRGRDNLITELRSDIRALKSRKVAPT